MKLLRKYMPTFLTAIFFLLTLVPAAFPALLDVGPTVPEVLNSSPPQHGYPLWYRDGNRVPLEICLSSATSPTVPGASMCNLLPGPAFNPALPISFPGNFPDEAFWFAGDAVIRNGNIRAQIVMGLEGAWNTGIVTPGNQNHITFARIRYIVDAPVAGTYRIIHPYGEKTFFNVPAGVHAIFDTSDIGIENGKFTGALQGGIGPFLTWDSGVPINVGGELFVGDPNVPHTITGSPLGTNFFRVEGPLGSNLDGLGNNFVQTNLFAITGKIYTPPIPTAVQADRVTYARDANGMQLSVFTTTNPVSNATNPAVVTFPANFALINTPSALQVSGAGIPTTALATNTTRDGKFFAATGSFADPGTIPATVQITNTADVPQSIINIPLVDEVAIGKANYNRSTNLLTIAASSSDRVAPPVLQAFMPGMTAPLGTLVNGQLVVTFPFTDNTVTPAKTYTAPPEKITVTSAAGGSLTTDVDAFLPLAPAVMTSPVNGSTLAGASQTFTWTNVGANSYQLWVGTAPGKTDVGIFHPGTATTIDVTGLPVNGRTIYVRLASRFGTMWLFNDYTYTAVVPATMTSPANATTLTSASQTFTWTNVGASNYQLWVGTAPGKTDIGIFRPGTATTIDVTGLPINGRTIYVRLASRFGTMWLFNDYTYTTAVPAAMTSPANATTFTGASQTFTWTNVGANSYQLWVGTAPGKSNIGVFNAGTATTTNLTGLPTNGTNIYVRLYTKFGTTWLFNDYIYTAALAPAAMISPVNASILAGASQTFTWSNAGASSYQLWVGTVPGRFNIGVFNPGTATTTNLTGLPANGSIIYVRLYAKFGTTWLFNDYTYTSGP